ncbi:MAG: DUF1194 domain-containing protein [Rhizobiaceae bacterium]|nr:DUF1194 domain-containing protein [Rhizobiaceae bacterium]
MKALKGSAWAFCGAVSVALSAFSPTQVAAQEAVDVELVLAVDVSLSMSYEELKIQRDGYTAALTHPDVINAIRDGIHGKIAVTYFEWAGDMSQYMVVPWTVIATREDAEAVAAQITASPPNSARRTSISGGLRYAQDLFAESHFRGLKRVIDISGDGPNNQGEYVDLARDDIVAQGIVINGLPLMTDGGMISSFDVQDLDRYYNDCVIGGPGAFMIPVNAWEQFPEAIRRKLVLEIAGDPGRDWWQDAINSGIAPVVKVAGYDCQVGEKRWRGRSWMWDETR